MVKPLRTGEILWDEHRFGGEVQKKAIGRGKLL